MASFNVRLPDLTGTTSAPSIRMRATFRACRRVSSSPMYGALEVEVRGGRRGRDTMLAGAGLGDDPLLAHPLGEQRLAEHVANLVRAGVVQVLALEQNPRAGLRGQPLRLVEQARGAAVFPQHPGQLGGELVVGERFVKLDVELVEGRDQCLRHEPSAVQAEIAAGIRALADRHALLIGTAAASPDATRR